MARKIKDISKEEEFDDYNPDFIEFNNKLKSKKTKELKGFKVNSKKNNIDVNLENGDIEVNGKKLDIKLDETTRSKLNIDNLRWINFRRVVKSYRMVGGNSVDVIGYGVGWQAKVDNKNIKRFVFVDRNGHKLEK